MDLIFVKFIKFMLERVGVNCMCCTQISGCIENGKDILIISVTLSIFLKKLNDLDWYFSNKFPQMPKRKELFNGKVLNYQVDK